jgi:hypothetical protein
LEFGDSGVTRLFCDACDKLVTVCYMGRAGEYCSRACLERCDAEREKVKMQEPPKINTAGLPKVKAATLEKVKIAQPEKVKTAVPEKVKPPMSSQAKTRHALAPGEKLEIQSRNQRRIERRAAIRRIRKEILKSAGREPTILEMQSRLKPLGLGASVRTVWKDMGCLSGKEVK